MGAPEGVPDVVENIVTGGRTRIGRYRLRDQGLATDRKYLFVIYGAKALRAAIRAVFGPEQACGDAASQSATCWMNFQTNNNVKR